MKSQRKIRPIEVAVICAGLALAALAWIMGISEGAAGLDHSPAPGKLEASAEEK